MAVTELGLTNRRARAADFMELTKPRITLMVLITTLVGFYMGSEGDLQRMLLVNTILGTALVAAGASGLNQYLERHLDARMVRTRTRPLPEGRILPNEALVFSSALAITGVTYLTIFVNGITGALGALTLAAYVFVYTPLKTRTVFCTLIGALPGAVPPLMGWTAARGNMDEVALSIFAFCFCGRCLTSSPSHGSFTEDYARGGFVMHSSGVNTGRQIILYCCVLIPVSLLPTLFGATGTTYFYGALLLGFIYLGYGSAVAMFRSNTHAHRLLRISVLYLPALLVLMMFDKV
jgi:protoheme IX farnesyltransferase